MAPSSPAGETLTRLLQPFPVPFFVLLSLYFFLKKATNLPTSNLLALRPDRLIVPCLAWTLVYTLMRLIKYHSKGHALEFDLFGYLLYGKGALQLYFLPYLLLFQAQALAVVLCFRGGILNALLGLVFATGAYLFGTHGSSDGHFGFQTALQTGLIYIALAYALIRSQAFPLGKRINLLVGLAAVGFVLTYAWNGRFPLSLGLLHAPLIGYGFSALALNWAFHSPNPFVGKLLTCSYGIYLAHFGFIETFEFLAEQAGYPLAPYSFGLKLTMGLLACSLCVGLISLLRTHRITSYLFLGEHSRGKGGGGSRRPETTSPAPMSGAMGGG